MYSIFYPTLARFAKGWGFMTMKPGKEVGFGDGKTVEDNRPRISLYERKAVDLNTRQEAKDGTQQLKLN